MPFKSDSQRKLCYLLKSKGQAGSWDCDEWSTETGKKKLPEHVKKQEEKKAGNVLVGGDGDNKKPSDFPKDVLSHAVEHELEHTNDRKVAEEIAIDHLTEDIDYYKKLKKVEGNKEASKYTDKLPGGIGDNKKPSDFPKKDLEGMYEEEKIHTSDPDIAKELAIDHLTEDKDYYKDLEKLKKSKKAAMLKLARLWSLPAKISKLAEVTTSPNRGAGDKEEGIVDHDSSEGMPKPKAVNNAPGEGAMPINSRLRSSSARKALIGATKKTFGVNPTGGSLFGKTSAKNFDFSSIGQKLDPSIIGAPSNQAAAKPVNPISQLGSTLKQVGSAMGDRATGAIRKGATDWAWGPNRLPRLDFVQRGEQVKQQVAGTQRAVGDMANAFKQTASGARAIGNAIPGMAKQSSNVWDTARNVGAGASGAGGALYNAFSGAMGNQQSYDALKEQANKPDFEKGINDWRQSFSAMGQVANNAANYAVPRIAGIALKAHDQYTSDPKYKPTWGQRAENLAVRTGLNSIRSGLPVSSIYNLMTSSGPKGKGILGTGAALTSTALNSVPGAAMTSTALNSVPGAGQVGQAVGQGINQAGQAVGQGIAKGVTNQAINYEAGRRTAGYALPVVDWMRANPWAKYMLGAGGLALGGYALRNLFGDGGDGQQAQGNPIESAMAQGYQQQAMQQLPRNYGNMYGMRG
jgi:hypothetical protein